MPSNKTCPEGPHRNVSTDKKRDIIAEITLAKHICKAIDQERLSKNMPLLPLEDKSHQLICALVDDLFTYPSAFFKDADKIKDSRREAMSFLSRGICHGARAALAELMKTKTAAPESLSFLKELAENPQEKSTLLNKFYADPIGHLIEKRSSDRPSPLSL